MTNNTNITNLYDIAKQIVDAYRANLHQDGYDLNPNSKLINFEWTVQFDDKAFVLKFMLPPEWQWAEFGRKPGPYPLNSNKGLGWVKSILKWLTVRSIIPKNEKGLPSEIARKNFAWAITKKIQREGFQGKHTLTRTLFENENVIDELAMEMTKILGQEITEDFIHIADGMKTIHTVSQQ